MQKMYDCPYSPGLQCNQKPILCDQTKFEVFCLMSILRNMQSQIKTNHEVIKKEGMIDAIDWLFMNDYIKDEYYNYSISDVIDKIKKSRSKELIEIRSRR